VLLTLPQGIDTAGGGASASQGVPFLRTVGKMRAVVLPTG
jgi:hypothetical protein